MTLLTSARPGAAVLSRPGTKQTWDEIERPYNGLLKGFDDRLQTTERRRSFIGDQYGARRPLHFITVGGANSESGHHVRRNRVSRLRNLERRNLWWCSIRDDLRSSFVALISRMNIFRNYKDQLRFSAR
jgi:hypothetical protein